MKRIEQEEKTRVSRREREVVYVSGETVEGTEIKEVRTNEAKYEEKKVKALVVEEKAIHEKVKTTLPARILTKPQSITVSEGDAARFTCDIDGEPAPTDKVKFSCAAESTLLNVREVIWYKDGKKLTESSHHQFHYSADGNYNLTIFSLSETDQGEYSCEIVGEGGSSRTCSTLFFSSTVMHSKFVNIYKEET
uniref:Ig-like domain-containing protein n=1 Tax=Erpetoichthys calabaricus TaxID=27687 RepID=A0A8C4X7I8_ERPCA